MRPRDEQPDLFGDEPSSKHWSIQWYEKLKGDKLLTPALIVLTYLQLSGKIDLVKLVSDKPLRLPASEAKVLEDNKLVPLKDKIKIEDGYLYIYGEGENILELISEIKKHKAVAAPSTASLPKKVRAKPRPKKKTVPQIQKEDKVEKCVRGILGEAEECTSLEPEDRDACIEKILRECNE